MKKNSKQQQSLMTENWNDNESINLLVDRARNNQHNDDLIDPLVTGHWLDPNTSLTHF